MIEPRDLDPGLRELLDRERADDPPVPAEAMARVLGRVLGSVGATAAPSPPGEAGSGAPAASAVHRIARPLSLVLAFGAGGIAGVLGSNAFRRPPQDRIVYVDRVVAPPPAPHGSESAPAPSPPVAEPPRAPSAAPSASSGDPAAERRLLEWARGSLGRGDPAGALAWLRRHEREYRSGQLAEEREALAIEALVALGRLDEARAREERFRQRYPTSVMLPAVEAAVTDAASP